MLTINTHRGLYHYNRLPFGVKSAPGIFQQIIDLTICGLEGVAAYLLDVIVTGRTQEKHRHNLEALFIRFIHHFQIRYLGCIIDKDGRNPDPEKFEVIRQMPVPKNVADFRSFFGMINYYGSFVAEMRQLRAPLHAFLKKNVPFRWNEECEAAFNRAKEVLASDLLLKHFDPILDIILAAEASDQMELEHAIKEHFVRQRQDIFRNVKIEEQFNRHHGAQKRSYHQEELVWVRDYRPGHEKWVPARVNDRYGRAVYDALPEEDDLWKRHANQMSGEKYRRVSFEKNEPSKMQLNQEDRRYRGLARTTADVKDNVKDRAPTIVPPTTTRLARQRRPPRRLQPDPKEKTYAMRSS